MKPNKKIRIASAKAIIITMIIMVIAWILQSNFCLVINRSESLPLHAVLVKKGKIPTKIDQIFVFKVRNNPHYKMQEMKFIKLVGGLAGDKIELRKALESEAESDENATKAEIYVAEKLIGAVKTQSLKGKTLTAIKPGIISANQFFAYSPNKDSFDSRYQDLGLIDASDIIGTAIASF